MLLHSSHQLFVVKSRDKSIWVNEVHSGSRLSFFVGLYIPFYISISRNTLFDLFFPTFEFRWVVKVTWDPLELHCIIWTNFKHIVNEFPKFGGWTALPSCTGFLESVDLLYDCLAVAEHDDLTFTSSDDLRNSSQFSTVTRLND